MALADDLADAAFAGDLDAVDRLLARGVEPDAWDGSALTPLALAGMAGHAKVVSRLLAAGANPDAEVGGGRTAFIAALVGDDAECLRLMIAAGADIDRPDSEAGASPLLWALGSSDVGDETIQLLIDAGAHVAGDAADGKGLGHWATVLARQRWASG